MENQIDDLYQHLLTCSKLLAYHRELVLIRASRENCSAEVADAHIWSQVGESFEQLLERSSKHIPPQIVNELLEMYREDEDDWLNSD